MNKKQYDLSILIPSRNEEWLAKTVKDLLEHKRGNTEIIVGLDGQWANPPVEDHEDVVLVYYPESIGQRQMTNKLCMLSNAKYVVKTDAHCAFDEGFDVKLMAEMQDNVTMVPIMRNLHVFNWVCPDGHTRYQGPSGPCKEEGCDKPTEKDVVWIPKTSPQSRSYCFDYEPHFQYFGQHCKRAPYKKQLAESQLTETMSLQGSFFMMTREKYWELSICDEDFGSWGSQGIEVAVKTWLSGGKVVVNHKTWYAHCFRTQGGDFGFPYPQSGNQVKNAKKFAKDLFFQNLWPLQVRPLSWLLDRFWPVNGWTDEQRIPITEAGKKFLSKRKTEKGMIFYTDNQLKLSIARQVQRQLLQISNDKEIPLVSVSLKKMEHMGENIHLQLERGKVTMFKQILAGLETSTAEYVFFCEHDVIYHPSHFDFVPTDRNTFYYNVNVWKIRAEDGHSLWVDNCRQVSGLCGFREELIKHYKERLALAESLVGTDKEWNRNWGYEPGTAGKTAFPTQFQQDTYLSEFPNLDIRHAGNLTPNRWSPDKFRNKKNCEGWTEKHLSELPGWEGNNYKF